MPVKILVDAMKSDNFLGRKIKKFSVMLLEKTAGQRLGLFEYYLLGKKVIDIGLGTGIMAKLLMKKNFKVVGVDVTNTTLYPRIQPILYDGKKIPFKNNSMDTGLLICVLHHCIKQIDVLKEAMRVCKRIIIMEDTFRNEFERFLVSARDSVGNFEFYSHDYHSSEDWLKIFDKLGWKSIYTKEWSSVTFYGMYGRQTLFVIEPISR